MTWELHFKAPMVFRSVMLNLMVQFIEYIIDHFDHLVIVITWFFQPQSNYNLDTFLFRKYTSKVQTFYWSKSKQRSQFRILQNNIINPHRKKLHTVHTVGCQSAQGWIFLRHPVQVYLDFLPVLLLFKGHFCWALRFAGFSEKQRNIHTLII